jgi:hypothetical protein
MQAYDFIMEEHPLPKTLPYKQLASNSTEFSGLPIP